MGNMTYAHFYCSINRDLARSVFMLAVLQGDPGGGR